LPFMFIFNTQLLLIGIDSAWHLFLTIATAILANLLFAAATQGWFMARNRWWEALVLLLVTFTLFRPGFWMDIVHPPYDKLPPTKIMEVVEAAPAGTGLRVWIEGEDLNGKKVSKGVLLPLGAPAPALQRLNAIGLSLMASGDQVDILGVKFGSRAAKLGIEQGFSITALELAAERPAKEWFFIPALVLLALVVVVQRRRARLLADQEPKPAAA
ncbi:MAG: DUF3394 domain-containing protein, partial [Candidatus Accumulibacter sp.]|nr:DUF3394 domain-containing protein [Accumulibacter sp.]